MYRIVGQHAPDQLLHRYTGVVLQRSRTYKINTVTYGTSSAAYLATHCFNRCAEEVAEYFLIAAATVLLQGSGFNLRKWNSSDPGILS